MRKLFFLIFLLLAFATAEAQNFTYSGFIYNSDGSGAVNVPVKLYKRTTPTLTGFTSQTNYNGHSYYRSTGSMTWTAAKAACENMNGHLATISNAAENNFLFNTWPSGWIGYYQDRVSGYTYSEPVGGFRWTETKVTSGISADYDISSYTSGTTLVDIQNSNNGTLYNSPTYSSTGGKYLTFNGSNTYAITGNLASSMGNTNNITIFAWVYPTGNGVIASELGTSSSSSGWHESVIEITGGNTLRIGLWTGIGITQLSTPITLNAWHMIAITYDGTTMKGYLNNVNFGSVSFTRQAAHQYGGNGEYFALGLADATNMGHGGYGSFRLGNFQVFNRALTADELDRTYNLYAYRYKTNQYTNWNGGEPNDSGGEDYAQFVGGGKWNDLPNQSLPYVLEFDYIVGFTPWVLYKTVYTNSSGYYSFNESTNPSVEWYIQFDAPDPITPLQISDIASVHNIILGTSPMNGLRYYTSDLNGDGRITVSDAVYLNFRKSGIFTSWVNSFNSRYFTVSEYNVIKNQSSNLKLTYPGVSSMTINSPVSGGTLNLYLVSPGYAGQVSF